MSLRQLLAAPGIHFLATRFAPAAVRRAAFDEKYRLRQWGKEKEHSADLRAVLLKHLRQGDLLLLGCGAASILENLDKEGMNSAIGVDLSAEALRIAKQYESKAIRFVQADMLQFETSDRFDVIMFSESLYYVPAAQQGAFLHRLLSNLKAGGVFLVTLAQPARYHAILEMIRKEFTVLEDRPLASSSRHMIVFRP